MLKWVKVKTKRLAKGYSVTVYSAEGTPAIIEERRYALETRSLVLFDTIYNGQEYGGFTTFRGAKTYIERKLEMEADANG